MPSDRHGKMRPAGPAVFLGHGHFKAKRGLSSWPQIQDVIRSAFVLCPKALWLGRILMVYPELWEDKCVSLPDHRISYTWRIQIVSAWVYWASTLGLLWPFCFLDQCHLKCGCKALHQNVNQHTAAFISKITLSEKRAAEVNGLLSGMIYIWHQLQSLHRLINSSCQQWSLDP